jgi:hypothetical protein
MKTLCEADTLTSAVKLLRCISGITSSLAIEGRSYSSEQRKMWDVWITAHSAGCSYILLHSWHANKNQNSYHFVHYTAPYNEHCFSLFLQCLQQKITSDITDKLELIVNTFTSRLDRIITQRRTEILVLLDTTFVMVVNGLDSERCVNIFCGWEFEQSCNWSVAMLL